MRFRSFLLASSLLPIAGCAHLPLHDNASKAPESGVTSVGQGAQIIHVGGSSIDVRIADDQLLLTHTQLLTWVETGAKAVSNVYGKFPVSRVTIEISSDDDGDEIHGAEYDGDLIRMRIGGRTPAAKLSDDWTMTHEMLHLAFPNMGEEHLWMNEGFSVYLEPIARARAGIVSERRYWRELIEGLPNGQPESGDAGLEQTHTWGRTYWGGTIFWFLVDLEIREQTHGRKSIDDVVKTILAAGGDGSEEWPMQRVLEMGDQASGTHVMHDVYDLLAEKPRRVEFDRWWRRLGIRYANGEVTVDDAAPLAWMRKAITARDGRGTP